MVVELKLTGETSKCAVKNAVYCTVYVQYIGTMHGMVKGAYLASSLFPEHISIKYIHPGKLDHSLVHHEQ